MPKHPKYPKLIDLREERSAAEKAVDDYNHICSDVGQTIRNWPDIDPKIIGLAVLTKYGRTQEWFTEMNNFKLQAMQDSI